MELRLRGATEKFIFLNNNYKEDLFILINGL